MILKMIKPTAVQKLLSTPLRQKINNNIIIVDINKPLQQYRERQQ